MADSLQDNIIPAKDARRLLSAHDGDVALLYIYRLCTGEFGLERAAQDLCRTRREIEAADEKLRRLELLNGQDRARPDKQTKARAVPPAPADELPEYRAEDIVRRSASDGSFAAVLAEASKAMGRTLSSVDMKILFGVYDYLGLPADVIMLLINFVSEQYELRYGGQRRPSARAIEKEAYYWVNREIITMERAEEYIKRAEARRGELAAVKDALGIKGRELTKTESEYISSWLDMGYGADAVAIAYDRTVTNTGSLRWSYMNKIILSWREKGLKTPQEIEEKDSRTKKAAPAAVKRGGKAEDFAALDSLLDKI